MLLIGLAFAETEGVNLIFLREYGVAIDKVTRLGEVSIEKNLSVGNIEFPG